MQHNYLRRKLKQYGYTRKAERLSILSDNPIIKKNFKDKLLNHTHLTNSMIQHTNFDNAALTGSYFYKCDFIHCKMNMADLEYCEFYQCFITSKSKVVSSFNESNFLNTEFKDITFSGCSFSGSLFEECIFDNVKIEFTTLENAMFRNCTFKNMDMKVLNLSFVEFVNPTMENVVLPLEQIPYAIGMLRYCMSRPTGISLGSDTLNELSLENYIDNVIPLLINEYMYTKDYFPLANIYLVQQDFQKVFNTLHLGLEEAVSKRDFRTLKFYCKLIAESHKFTSKDLRGFYDSICKLSPQGKSNSSLMRGYVRNIAEIKNILFDSVKDAAFHITLLAECATRNINRIGELLMRLLGLTRMGNFRFPNTSSVKIMKNSPLFISIDINGHTENIAYLLPELLSLSCAPCDTYQLKTNVYVDEAEQCYQFNILMDECRSFCTKFGITLTVVEYCFENYANIWGDGGNVYYYNNDYRKCSNLLAESGRENEI